MKIDTIYWRLPAGFSREPNQLMLPEQSRVKLKQNGRETSIICIPRLGRMVYSGGQQSLANLNSDAMRSRVATFNNFLQAPISAYFV